MTVKITLACTECKQRFRRQFCSALLSGNIVQYFLYVFRRDV